LLQPVLAVLVSSAFGAQFRTMQAGWIVATRCGDTNIVVAETRLADADRVAREWGTDLREHYARDIPPC